MNSLPDEEEMLVLIKEQCESLPSVERKFLEARLIPLQRKTLYWEYGKGEPYDSWVFADFKEREVGVTYCKGGFGEMGSPWGLIFFHDAKFGMDCGWYDSLLDLIQDGWIE